MTLTEAFTAKSWTELIALLDETKKDTANYVNEYAGQRDERDDQVGKREDKNTDAGLVSVNRIPVQFQKKIVKFASSYLLGNPIRLQEVSEENGADNGEEEEESEEFQLFKTRWSDLRLDSLLLQMATMVKSQTESALLFRLVSDGVIQEEDKGVDLKIKASIIGKNDTELMPGFDEFGQLIVFGYKINVKDEEGNEVSRIYMYDKTNVTILQNDGQNYVEYEPGKPHGFNRIPVVYISQEEPEWYDVKELIDRYEMNLSKFADTNDYFASPFFKATGDVTEAPKRDDTGRVYMLDVIETDKGTLLKSDMEVVSWDQSTESTKLEFDEVKGLIHDLTDTPDLGFDSVKGLGNISGIAIKLMFLSPHIKAKYSEAIFRTMIERVVNVLRAGLVYGTMEIPVTFFETRIDVEFTSILPNNIQELISTLSEATFNKPIMSQRTAVERNPLVKNVKKELERMKEDDEPLGDSLNV